MKKIYIILGIVVASFLSVQKAEASHAMGVDLSYKHIFGNLYEITLTFYRDCGGISAPTTASVNISSPSACGATGTATLTLVGSGEVSPLCPSQVLNSTCNGGTLPGVEQYVLTGTYTLPAQCPDWLIYYSLCCRNEPALSNPNLTSPSLYDLYVEAHLDNTAGLNNSSPQFTTLPVPYICANQPFSYNHGAFDSDGDSLVYSLVNALDFGAALIPYNAPASPTNPIVGVPNIFDTQTGTIQVNPDGSDDLAVMAILVEEYRNGVLIGSTMRDIQIVIQTCTNQQPVDASGGIVNQTGGVYIDANSVEVCPGEALSFDVVYSDPNAPDIVTLLSNVTAVLPGATFTSTGTNPTTGTFTWTPSGTDAGFHNFTITVQDNGCPVLGSQVFAFDILVQSGTYAGADQTLCPGGVPAQLGASGGSVFNWATIAGTPISVPANFSCNPCANPFPTPPITTTYEVTSNLSGLCKNKDTVTINVTGGFTLNMPPNQTICLNEAVNLPTSTSGGTYTYNWTPAASLNNPTVSNPLANPTSTTTYTVTVTNTTTGCTNQDVVDVTVSGVGPTVGISNDTSICFGESVPLSSFVVPECDNYSVSAVPYSAAPGGGWTTVVLGDDAVSAALPVGFNFDFYCNSYNQFYIGSNGYLGFTNVGMTSLSSQILPSATTPNNIIAIGMVDLYPPGAGTIAYKTVGPVGNRVLYVAFNGIPHCCGVVLGVTAYAKLYEADNAVEIHSTSIVNDGSTITQGIENFDGTMGLAAPGRNSVAFNATNSAYRFAYPSAVGPYTYAWTGGGLSNNSVSNPTATPSSTTTYVLDITDVPSGCPGTNTVTVNVGANYTLNTTNNNSICYGDTMLLNTAPSTGGSFTYIWTPNGNMINPFTASPTIFPTSTTTYTVQVDNGGCLRTDNVTINVAGGPVSASIDKDTICPGETVQLDVGSLPTACGTTPSCAGAPSNLTVGTGGSATGSGTPYEGGWYDGRIQILYTAADLSASGMSPGAITELAFWVATKNSTQPYNNFTISMAAVNMASLGGFQGGLSTVFGPVNYSTNAGWNTHTLDIPFNWNGSCDLLIEVCFDGTSYTIDDPVRYTTTPYMSVQYDYADNAGSGGCILNTPLGSSNRPNTRFTMCTPSLPGGATFTWTGPVSNSGIQNPNSIPTTNQTYNVVVVDPSAPACPSNASISVILDSAVFVTASADNYTPCPSDPVQLNATPIGSPLPAALPSCGANGTACTQAQVVNNIGNGTLGSATYSAFYGFYHDAKTQYLFQASDLIGQGMNSGIIDALSLNITSKASTIPYNGLRIYMNCTATNNLTTAGWEPVGTQVLPTMSYSTVAGWNNFIFTTPFDWDGSSNIVVTICYNNTAYTSNDAVRYSNTSYVSTMHEYQDGAAGCGLASTFASTYSTRADMRFRVCPPPPNPFTYSWSPTTGLSDPTIANPTFNATGNQTYVVTVNGGKCTVTDTVNIVVCVLPLEMLSFGGYKDKTDVLLEWVTMDEDNLAYFDVERSENGTNFEKIGNVGAKGDNSGAKFNYQFKDYDPNSGINYYRLKIVDENNEFSYSSKVVVDFAKTDISVYPNPVSHGASLFIDLRTEGTNVQVELLDVTGRTVSTETFNVETGKNTIEMSTDQLSMGSYVYKVTTKEEKHIGKILITN